MRRAFPQLAIIARRGHYPATEMVLPDAVHNHARSQRIRSVGNGVRQFLPPAAFMERLPVFGGKDREKPPRSDLAQIVAVAADLNLYIRRLLLIRDDLQIRVLLRQLFL